MPIPLPGKPVRGSRTGRPVMALLDLLGRRWALRVIWELRDRPLTFRELRTRCGDVSPTALNRRLQELRAAGILVSTPSGYALTAEGRRLFECFGPIKAWAERWAKRSTE